MEKSVFWEEEWEGRFDEDWWVIILVKNNDSAHNWCAFLRGSLVARCDVEHVVLGPLSVQCRHNGHNPSGHINLESRVFISIGDHEDKISIVALVLVLSFNLKEEIKLIMIWLWPSSRQEYSFSNNIKFYDLLTGRKTGEISTGLMTVNPITFAVQTFYQA